MGHVDRVVSMDGYTWRPVEILVDEVWTPGLLIAWQRDPGPGLARAGAVPARGRGDLLPLAPRRADPPGMTGRDDAAGTVRGEERLPHHSSPHAAQLATRRRRSPRPRDAPLRSGGLGQRVAQLWAVAPYRVDVHTHRPRRGEGGGPVGTSRASRLLTCSGSRRSGFSHAAQSDSSTTTGARSWTGPSSSTAWWSVSEVLTPEAAHRARGCVRAGRRCLRACAPLSDPSPKG